MPVQLALGVCPLVWDEQDEVPIPPDKLWDVWSHRVTMDPRTEARIA